VISELSPAWRGRGRRRRWRRWRRIGWHSLSFRLLGRGL